MGDFWTNVKLTHYPASRSFSKRANLFTWSLLFMFLYGRWSGMDPVHAYIAMTSAALMVALVHEATVRQDVLQIEGARLVDGVPQLAFVTVLFVLALVVPVFFGYAVRFPPPDRTALFAIAAIAETLWFFYVMPQVVPYGLFVAPFAFVIQHPFFIDAYTTGTFSAATVETSVVAGLFGVSNILLIGARSWLRGHGRAHLFAGTW